MRIVTCNTRGSLGMDNMRSTGRIARVLRALTPDVLCFQEIHRRLPWSRREDQPEVLSRLLARPFAFQQLLTFGFGGYGIGIAYRGELAARREHLLPSRKEQRGALELRLRNVGEVRAVTVICTHWGLQAEERLQQAEALASIVQEAAHPIAVCGDFNEGPEGDAIRAFLATTGLSDVGRKQSQATFSADNPTERIDFIFISPELQAAHFETVPSQASDHLPVLADLKLSL